MNRRRLYHDGKTKVLYEGPEPETLIQHFKDNTTAFHGTKQGIIEGKGVLNNRISEFLFQALSDIGLPTHFIRRLNMREQLTHKLEMFPLEIVVRNVVAGSLAKRFDLEEGIRLPRPIMEFYHRNDKLENPLVSEEHIMVFNWASASELDDMAALSMRANDFLSGLFLGVGIQLVDIRFQVGRLWEDDVARIILADEISPDTCRLWDVKTKNKLDKDRFRYDLGGVMEAYTEVARRLGILLENGNPSVLKGPQLVPASDMTTKKATRKKKTD